MMDAEEFYEAYKAALVFLGVNWGDKRFVDMLVIDTRVVMSYQGKQASIQLPPALRLKECT